MLAKFTARVAEMEDALDLGSSPEKGGGSIPPLRIIVRQKTEEKRWTRDDRRWTKRIKEVGTSCWK